MRSTIRAALPVLFLAVLAAGSAPVYAAETFSVQFKPSPSAKNPGWPTPPSEPTYGFAYFEHTYVVAVWLEDGSGNFVRTIGRWGTIRWHALKDWQAASGYDTDAMTGATVLDADLNYDYSPLTASADIQSVPDGTYSIKLELTNWEIPNYNGQNRATYTFTKNGTSSSQSPSNQGGFSNVTINYGGRSAGSYAPGVYAGPDQWVALPASASLQGVATDNGGPPSVTWRKDSGPGTVTFGNASALNTSASFSMDGVYVLELEADDGSLQSYDYVKVQVNAVEIIATEDSQVTISPINPLADDTNFNGDFRIRMYNFGGSDQSEGYVKFNLSSVPATVATATLRISFNDYNDLVGPYAREVRDVSNDSWDADTITWNTKPGSGSVIDTFTTGYGWREADLTSFIRTQHGGDGTASIRTLRGSTPNYGSRFNSEETYVGPRLLVTYNRPPSAYAGTNQTVFDAGGDGSEQVTLNGSGSSDPDGIANIQSYVWREGVTQIATGQTPTLSFTVGIHTVTLEVTDYRGESSTDTVTIAVEGDTDLDGIPDTWEIQYFGSAAACAPGADADGDNLSNLGEYNAGTHPLDGDTDDDGLDDGDEVAGVSPWSPTDPLDPDSDDDGLSDGEEVAGVAPWGPTDPNASDSDGDGWSDGDEVEYDADPNDPDSYPVRPFHGLGGGCGAAGAAAVLVLLAIVTRRRGMRRQPSRVQPRLFLL